MFKVFRRWWAYLTAKLSSDFNERADPKIQLEQAITEAQEQQRRLKEQAANVIAHQKQTEIRLNRAMGELEKVGANARQAVLMADEASKGGDQTKAGQYTVTAESFANRLIALEREVEDLKALHLQSTEAANQAKAAVQQNSSVAGQAGRAPEAALPARPGQDAGADEQGDVLAVGGGGPGRAHAQRGARQDRGPLRQGQGHGRADREARWRPACWRWSRPRSTARPRPGYQIRSQLGLGAPAEQGQVGWRRPTPPPPTPPAPPPAGERPRRGPDWPTPTRASSRGSASAPIPGPGPTTIASTPSCWRGATAATSSTSTATGRSRPSSQT